MIKISKTSKMDLIFIFCSRNAYTRGCLGVLI